MYAYTHSNFYEDQRLFLVIWKLYKEN